jgi:hypothetical protein
VGSFLRIDWPNRRDWLVPAEKWAVLSKNYGISLKRQALGRHFEDKIRQFAVIRVAHTLLGRV